jgi:hypothetical protein
MSEVLKLEYSASTEGLVVELDAVENGRVILGAPHPTSHLTLAELAEENSRLADDIRSVLSRLEPVVRSVVDARVQAAIADPTKLTEREAELARREAAVAAREAALPPEDPEPVREGR